MKTNKWIITDPSCNQKRMDISETRFLFAEDRIIDPKTGERETYESEIDLDNYDWFEIVEACEVFGYSAKQVDDWLNTGEEFPLIAECLFELEN
jgi:hypothetical protein